ncbi:dynactin 6 [Cryptococcus deuterogattii R265]|uniref:dynactin 6 n=1 Tax=Cryptococcus deuterogattii (strain R265) TaxID=294750 RepID=UPI0019387226|nr:dynactin 6 [Cryptococcus deuterogattii R265]
MSSPTLTAHSTSLICADTDLRGPITIGPNVIIHPRATIYAAAGPIVLGERCIVEEGCIIVNRKKDTMRIGENNHFMVGCRIESPFIGDNNTFQPRSTASAGVIVTDNCIISAGTILLPSPAHTDERPETLPPYTVIYGAESSRRTWDGSGQVAEMALRRKHAEFLREIIPKFNRLRPTT